MAMDLAGNETNSTGFLLRVWRLSALFPFDWSIKSELPLSSPLQKVISRAKLFALCWLLRGIPSPLWRSQAEWERVGNISSRFIERSINRSLLPLTLWPLLTPGPHITQSGKLELKPIWQTQKLTNRRTCEIQHLKNVCSHLSVSLF